MVFPKTLHYLCTLLRGASGVAPDLVASANDAGLEDRTHHSDPCTQLVILPGHDGIDSDNKGLLQADGRAMKTSAEISSHDCIFA